MSIFTYGALFLRILGCVVQLEWYDPLVLMISPALRYRTLQDIMSTIQQQGIVSSAGTASNPISGYQDRYEELTVSENSSREKEFVFNMLLSFLI